MPLTSSQDPVGNGWRYPVQVYRGGISYSGAQKAEVMNDVRRRSVIRQAIRQTIFTSIKEWIMRRRFGSRLRDVPFDTLQDGAALLERHVIEAINRFEKRVMNVRANIRVLADEGALEIEATYTIKSIGSSDSMTFPWYLADSGV